MKVEPRDRHRGYLKIGEAKMHQRAKADLKASYIWGIDQVGDLQVSNSQREWITAHPVP